MLSRPRPYWDPNHKNWQTVKVTILKDHVVLVVWFGLDLRIGCGSFDFLEIKSSIFQKKKHERNHMLYNNKNWDRDRLKFKIIGEKIKIRLRMRESGQRHPKIKEQRVTDICQWN